MSRSAPAADSCISGTLTLALVAGLSLPMATHAQAPEPVELTWDAPAGCPDLPDVQARLRALAGSATSRTDPPLRATATITAVGRKELRLRLVVRSNGLVGERTLTAQRCEELARFAAVHLALLLKDANTGKDTGKDTDTASPAGSSQRASPASSEAARRPAPPVATQKQTGLSALLQAPTAAVSLGSLPTPSFGIGMAVGLALRPYYLIASGTWWLRQTFSGELEGSAARADRIALGVHACRVFTLIPRLDLAPCLSVSLEHLWARGAGRYVEPSSAAATWVAAGAGLQARAPLTHALNLLVSAFIKVQTARPRISIEGVGRLAELGPVAGELSLGAEWIL